MDALKFLVALKSSFCHTFSETVPESEVKRMADKEWQEKAEISELGRASVEITPLMSSSSLGAVGLVLAPILPWMKTNVGLGVKPAVTMGYGIMEWNLLLWILPITGICIVALFLMDREHLIKPVSFIGAAIGFFAMVITYISFASPSRDFLGIQEAIAQSSDFQMGPLIALICLFLVFVGGFGWRGHKSE